MNLDTRFAGSPGYLQDSWGLAERMGVGGSLETVARDMQSLERDDCVGCTSTPAAPRPEGMQSG